VKYLTRVKEFCSCLLYTLYIELQFICCRSSQKENNQNKRRDHRRREGKEKKKESLQTHKTAEQKSRRKKSSLPAAEIRARKSPSIAFIRSGSNLPVVTAKRIKLIDSTRVLKI